MKHRYHFVILAAISTASFVTGAESIYENTNKDGVVEFSDQRSPNAKAITVKPNVVNVVPVSPIGQPSPQPSTPPTETTEAPVDNVQHEVVEEGYAYGQNGNRERLRESEERRERGPKPVQLPAPALPREGAGVGAGVPRR